MRAVIYCRVSTKEQAKNLSLPAQRKACVQFCLQQNWTVDQVYVERGESAKTANRTELKNLLAYCRKNRGRLEVMVVYSLDRFARNNFDHYAVRALLANLGMTLRAVTQPIDETPTGKLMEGVLAAVAQFDNDIRAEKTSLGMKEALRRGRWTFPAPLGYRNVRRIDGSKTIEPDPERAPLLRRAFELYASGLHSQSEILAQVSASGLRTRRGRPVGAESLNRMLRDPLYAGRIRVDSWGIEAKGTFDPIVDEHTFHRVQALLHRSALIGKHHHRNHPEFPLRRFVRCGACGSPLTASRSRSKTGRYYRYYRCPKCDRVNVRKETLEERFLQLLDRLKPQPRYLEALRESVLNVWKEQQRHLEEAKPVLQRKLAHLQEQKRRLVDAFVYRQAIDEPTYQNELDRIREAMVIAEVEINENRLDELDVEAVLAFAEHVVLNARRLWSEYPLELRRQLQKVLFPDGLAFHGEGFGTPVTCLFFRPLEASEDQDSRLVARAGFEPVLPRETLERRHCRGNPSRRQ